MRGAKLRPDLHGIQPETLNTNLVNEAEHGFHEGASIRKRNSIYYLVYADISRGRPTCLAYATSRFPLGPFTKGGIIIDNTGCDPETWNNHGSIAAFNGQWYVFYHRSSQASNFNRRVCVEPIRFNADGSIDEVEMTSQGAGGPLDALSKIDAERACLLFGNVRIEAIATDNEALAGIRNEDRAAFKYIDFGDGVEKVTVRIAPGARAGKIALALDMPWRHYGAALDIPAGVDRAWQTLTFDVKKISGVHALWLNFYGEGDDLFDVDWLSFAKTE